MEDLKLKFKLFINKQGTWKENADGDAHFSEELSPSGRETSSTVAKQQNSQSSQEEQLTDQDILKSIEDIYFSSNDFDPSKYELLRLPEQLSCDGLQTDLKRLRRQLDVVSSQVLQLILAQQPACQDEFKRVEEVQRQLQSALEVCRTGRSQLGLARRHFTTASLGLLANYRKRQRALNLLQSLSTIKTLQRTEERLQELLREEDFSGAISLLLECQSAASTFRHFSCVAALNGQLQDTLLMAEESLDQALAKSCLQFDASQYSKLQAAYALLGKTQIAADQLVMHFTSAVHNAAFSIVSGLAGDSVPSNSKKSYPDLCKYVTREKFIKCLVDLCGSLWYIVSCYREIAKWHTAHPTMEKGSGAGMEATMAAQYVRQKLEMGRARVWNDVQAKVAALLLGCEPANFKFDEFLQVLDLVDRLVRVGDEFCESGSKELQTATRTQSLNYLRGYHLARMDELCMFLENEGWARCPVRSTFCALQLQEFRWAGISPSISRTRSSSSRASTTSSDEGFFSRFPRSSDATPFDLRQDDVLDEDFFATNGEGVQSEESDEEEEEVDGHVRGRGGRHAVLVANTTLSVLRLIGRYLRMMRLLQPIALDVLRRLTQLVDLYLYAVHSFFARDMPGIRENEYSYPLQASLKRVHETLIQSSTSVPATEATAIENETVREKVSSPRLSPIVQLDNPDDLHGLAERLVAVESLAFLADQLAVLRPQIQALLPQDQWPALDHFYKQLEVAEDLRKPVYMCVAWHALDLRQLLAQMTRVNWEVRDVMSQHSPYVDIVLRELQIFSMRLAEVGKKVPVPRTTRELLWQLLSHLVCNTFVEGFASAKRCSNGGRGLMQLDFTQFASKLEKIAELRPIPGSEIVEQYVKAYYLPEPALEAWIREHSEYSGRQLVSLVTCACQNNKKTRQLLLGLIEELGR